MKTPKVYRRAISAMIGLVAFFFGVAAITAGEYDRATAYLLVAIYFHLDSLH